jgi:parallel beta-helix repeat protein
VDNSGGVVTMEPNDQYIIHEDLTISTNDTISIFNPEEINVADAVLITVNGTMISDPLEGGIVFFKAQNNHYLGFRFDESDGSSFTSTYFKKAGGIDLIYSDVEFTECDFTEFNQEYATGTVDLFHSSPLIQDCSFSNNEGPAVMSGANVECSPQIINCQIEFNVAGNGNTPQINLGTSGADSIRIMNCQIIGDPANEMAGGIAVTTLFGGSAKARIEGNEIRDNRYGITCYGNNVGSLIRGNEIRDNNTQGQPMLGGSGINFFGDETNQSIVTGNIITGNLWGITIQNSAQPNFGQLEGDIINPGNNTFMDNGNEGEIYDLYNNTPNPIMAENNYWGTDDVDMVEEHIFHQPDDPTLGFVDYLPILPGPVGFEELSASETNNHFSIYPNPAQDFILIELDENSVGPVQVKVFDAAGKLVKRESFQTVNHPIRIAIPDEIQGVALIRISSGDFSETQKIIVR